MSEATSRSSASRGRGSGRGGRGGFAGRGGRRTNGSDSKPTDEAFGAFDDDGELAELRKKYGDKTGVIREMFPDWSEVDVLFALQETNGDQTEAVTKIAEGAISQWGEVSKPKKASKPKAKDAAPASTSDQNTTTARATRGGRAVSEGARGRGRATERGGRGGTRGRTAQPATTAGARNKENEQLSVPTEESPAWGTAPTKTESKPIVAEQIPAEAPKPAAPAAKTWASMLRQTAVPKPAPKEAPRPKAPEATPTPAETKAPALDTETTPVAQAAVAIIEEPALPPPKDDLTETNLEQVVDDSQPPATGTAASTAADSWDPRQSPISSNATPLSAAHQQHQSQRAPISGYAATAIKATERNTRAPSFQRRVLDQEEAVRMPGNRDVDRTAVKFGAFSLNGGDDDVDGDREDAETRPQPPADSPVSHPRASLPPVQQQHAAVPDAFSQKPAAPSAPPGINPAGAGAQGAAQAVQPGAPNSQQYGRFGQTGPQDAGKPIDPFGQQAASASQPPFDLNATSQPPAHGAFSSAPGDYSNYYTANQQDRNPYNYYGQQYGQQQGVHGQHDGAAAQRPVGGYNAQADNLSQYPQSSAAHSQPRFGASADNQNSGQSTPNPASQAQQQQGQGAPGSQPQAHGQQYPGYNHPYYPYYHQYYSGYGQGGFGGPYGKGGMYGQPYGVSPNAPYDHATTQGNFGPSTLHRDNSLGSGLGDYGRAQSGQAGSQPGLGGSGFSGSHDSFQRGAGSFQTQSAAAASDDLKPFGDKAGPSPSLGGARPGSAANNTPGQGSGLPPPQGGAYGGYPSHLQGHGAHGSGGYGMGGAAGANQHANAPYGSYGQGFGSAGGYYGAGGQQQQQQQQQRGGWGGNYH